MPSELLIAVFSYFVPNIGPIIAISNDEIAPLSQDLVNVHAKSVVKLSQVCRHWRNLAMSCAGLWRTIFLPRDLHLAPTFLSLSRPLLIDLGIDHMVSSVSPTLARWDELERFLGPLLLQEPKRIRSVHLQGIGGREYSSCELLLRAQLVNLEKLSLGFRGACRDEEDPDIERLDDSDMWTRLADIIFSSETIVNLRQLALLYGEWPRVQAVKLRGLTQLFMYDFQILGFGAYRSFLDTLEGTSQTLETLYLESCGPGCGDDQEDISYHIHLPQRRIAMAALRSVYLLDMPVEGLPLHFLQNLVIPSHTTIAWDVYATRFKSCPERFELPPSDCLARVKRILVGGNVSESRADNFLLDQKREILVIPDHQHFHPTGGRHEWAVEGLPRFLPNLDTVYFYEVDSFHDVQKCLFYANLVTTIVASVVSRGCVVEILAAVEKFSLDAEGNYLDEGDLIVPGLTSLTIYTGPLDFSKERVQGKIMRAMNRSGVTIPGLWIDKPQERERPYGHRYTLTFKSGSLDDHDAEYNFPFPRQAQVTGKQKDR